MSQLQELTLMLAEATWEGHQFNCLPLLGEQAVVQVLVSDLDELPIFVTRTDTQMLCISYLFRKDELRSECIDELNRLMLEMNIPMPLSSFALVDDYYVIFGALANNSRPEDLMKELVTLARNSQEALQAMEEYLN